MGGPLVLRYTSDKGTRHYWNWDRIARFQIEADRGWLFMHDNEVFHLTLEEAKQVAAQLDMLIDPPMMIWREDWTAAQSTEQAMWKEGE